MELRTLRQSTLPLQNTFLELEPLAHCDVSVCDATLAPIQGLGL